MAVANSLDNVFNKVLGDSRIFSNRDSLRHDYIPSTLPHRDRQIQRLGGILAPALNGSKISNAFLYGKSGTGKTAVAKYVLTQLQSKAAQIGVPIRVAYVNCRFAGTNYRVLADLSRAIGIDVPFTGLAAAEVLSRFQSLLASARIQLIIILDEIDALVKRQQDDAVLYELTRMNEILSAGWIGMVGISNDLHFKDSLDPRVLSCLSEEEVVFRPYMADELYDILSSRAKISFIDGAVSESSIRLCAALTAGEHGDARRALDLLRVAGEVCERESDKQVIEEHVRLAEQKIEHDRVGEALISLPIHSKMLIVATYIINSHGHDAAVTGDVYNVYHEICGSGNLEPLTQRRVSGLINELDIMGILNTRVVSLGRYGRTKRIRLGVDRDSVIRILSGDALVSPLLSHSPTCLQKRRVT